MASSRVMGSWLHCTRWSARIRVLALLVAWLSVAGWQQWAWGTVGIPQEGLPQGTGIRLLDVAAEDANDPRANQYIVGHAIPGATFERRVRVSNGTPDPVAVNMQGAAARIGDDGWVILGEGETPADSFASWVSFDTAEFVLAPNSVFDVTATIEVPPGTPPGERYGAIVAQPPGIASGRVNLISGVGVRVYLSVGGDEPVTDFEIDTLTASRTEEGAPSVDVGILNTGGRAIDVAGELELEDESGSVTAGPFPTALPRTLAPRSRGQVTVPLPNSLASGPWKVTATMRSGLVERVAEATIVFPDEPGTAADPAESETIGGTDAEGNDISEEIRNQRRTLLPLAAILILLAIAALYMMLLWKRREEEEDDEDETVVVGATSAVGEDDGS